MIFSLGFEVTAKSSHNTSWSCQLKHLSNNIQTS